MGCDLFKIRWRHLISLILWYLKCSWMLKNGSDAYRSRLRSFFSLLTILNLTNKWTEYKKTTQNISLPHTCSRDGDSVLLTYLFFIAGARWLTGRAELWKCVRVVECRSALNYMTASLTTWPDHDLTQTFSNDRYRYFLIESWVRPLSVNRTIIGRCSRSRIRRSRIRVPRIGRTCTTSAFASTDIAASDAVCSALWLASYGQHFSMP